VTVKIKEDLASIVLERIRTLGLCKDGLWIGGMAFQCSKRDELGRQQRVAAEVKEVIVDADLVDF
jgi:hypothetical protein